MTIPSFRRSGAPKREETKRDRKRERFRGSRQSRGYDREWEVLRDAYFKAKKGICEECARRGYLEMAEAVDHLIPVVDAPDKRLDWDNLQCICRRCHAAKYKWEVYARKTGQVSLLPMWVRHPETRPSQFAILKRGPMARLFDEDEGTAADSAE